MSLLSCFDIAKIELLLEFYEHGEDQVRQRALVGLLYGLSVYDDRLQYYPQLVEKLLLHADNEQLASDIETVVIQFVKSSLGN